MGSLIVRIVGAVGAAILSVTMLGNGVASADALTGKTYDEASGMISGWHGEPVIGTVSGDQLATDDCIVTSWQKSMFLNSSGDNDRSNEYVLHLNCNNLVAAPGHPGNSLMTPQGAAAKRDQRAATNVSKNPAYCDQSDEIMEWCQKLCQRTGLCEI